MGFILFWCIMKYFFGFFAIGLVVIICIADPAIFFLTLLGFWIAITIALIKIGIEIIKDDDYYTFEGVVMVVIGGLMLLALIWFFFFL
jgi:hypothetical protein